MNGEDYAWYQLIARATYLPKGHLVAIATYLRLRLRYQLVDMSTYLAKPRFRLRSGIS
jgi:hypothetical protein